MTCTDDLGVTLNNAEEAVLHEQNIPSNVRDEFISGRRIFRRTARSQEANRFLSNCLNSPGRPHSARPTGGSARSRSDRVVWQDRGPVASRGPSHIPRTSRLGLH